MLQHAFVQLLIGQASTGSRSVPVHEGQAPLIDIFPLWVVFLATIIVCVTSLELGFRIGRARGKATQGVTITPVGNIASGLLALLAFLLSFTFSSAFSRHETRSQLVLDEALALKRTWLRAELLPSESEEKVHQLLREYVQLLVEVARTRSPTSADFQRVEEIQRQLWSLGAVTPREHPAASSPVLFVDSLNEVFDLNEKRISGLGRGIPIPITVSLYLLAILAILTIGYLTGLGGVRRTTAAISLVLAFSMVIVLISDLDSPQRGFIRVSQAPLEKVLRDMQK